jgi:hypothetical protein
MKTSHKTKERRNKIRYNLGKAATDTHIVLDLLVGAGIDQQPHAVRMTASHGAHQRGMSVL